MWFLGGSWGELRNILGVLNFLEEGSLRNKRGCIVNWSVYVIVVGRKIVSSPGCLIKIRRPFGNPTSWYRRVLISAYRSIYNSSTCISIFYRIIQTFFSPIDRFLSSNSNKSRIFGPNFFEALVNKYENDFILRVYPTKRIVWIFWRTNISIEYSLIEFRFSRNQFDRIYSPFELSVILETRWLIPSFVFHFASDSKDPIYNPRSSIRG